MPAQLTPFNALSVFKAEAVHEADQAQSERRCLSRLAELLLLNRLRARTRGDLVADMLERAASVIEVTSRHWFAAGVSAAGIGRSAHPPAPQAGHGEPQHQALGGEVASALPGPAADQLA
jgi:hypothetical protein